MTTTLGGPRGGVGVAEGVGTGVGEALPPPQRARNAAPRRTARDGTRAVLRRRDIRSIIVPGTRADAAERPRRGRSRASRGRAPPGGRRRRGRGRAAPPDRRLRPAPPRPRGT